MVGAKSGGPALLRLELQPANISHIYWWLLTPKLLNFPFSDLNILKKGGLVVIFDTSFVAFFRKIETSKVQNWWCELFSLEAVWI